MGEQNFQVLKNGETGLSSSHSSATFFTFGFMPAASWHKTSWTVHFFMRYRHNDLDLQGDYTGVVLYRPGMAEALPMFNWALPIPLWALKITDVLTRMFGILTCKKVNIVFFL